MLAEYYRNPEYYLNIFYLDDDPEVAARMHCDKHVVKMILETAQILSTVWQSLAHENPEADWTRVLVVDWQTPREDTPYKEVKWLHARLCGQRIYNKTHERHPSVLWARLYGGNYDWLYKLGCALLEEYTYRYGKIHACTPVMQALELIPPPLLDTLGQYCEVPACMPNEFVVEGNAVESYRRYYKRAKTALLQYTERTPPDWIADVATHI